MKIEYVILLLTFPVVLNFIVYSYLEMKRLDKTQKSRKIWLLFNLIGAVAIPVLMILEKI